MIQTLLDHLEQAGMAVHRHKAQHYTAKDKRDKMTTCVKELEAEVERLKQAATRSCPSEPRPMAPLLQWAISGPTTGPSTSVGAPAPRRPYNGRDEALAWRIAEVDEIAFDDKWDEQAEFDKEVKQEITTERGGSRYAGRSKGKAPNWPMGGTPAAPTQL
jgi:hypothetical protein